jgi:predicted site-specific integrase-resolvase
MASESKPAFLADYSTEEETANGLGVCVKTLRNWRRDGRGPPVTFVGTKPYYSNPSTVKWLRSQERAAQGSTNAHAA